MGAALLDEFGRGDNAARAEAWRYSKLALRALEQNEFVVADPAAELSPNLIAQFDWPETRGRRLVFVNGHFSDSYSNWSEIKTSIRVDIQRGGANRLALDFPSGRHGVVHLVYVSVPTDLPSRWAASIETNVQEKNHVELIEQHLGDVGADVLGTLPSASNVAGRSVFRVTTLSDLPDSMSLYRRTQTNVQASARLDTTHVLFGGRLQRFDLDVELAGEQAEYTSHGVFVPRARQHIDVHLDAKHLARDTRSDVSWRGVADQRGRGILHGAITVAPGADGADAQLRTKNLLLSPHAEIDAQPVLEIYADEVKAAHGATVGQLDERALFYLRSRGVPLTMARNLLIAGFCREAFAGVGDVVLRARLEDVLAARLPQATEITR